jgi:hypothetical protein
MMRLWFEFKTVVERDIRKRIVKKRNLRVQ